MNWQTKLFPGTSPDGAPILSLLAKCTYRYAPGKPAFVDTLEQLPFIEADEYWGQGNPAVDALKLESDLVAYKPMTDVVVLGYGHVPQGKQAYHLDVGIQVGTARKVIRALGDRRAYVTATGIAFSEPKPFDRMPLVYSLAYGGSDDLSDEGVRYAYPLNPVGKGFVVKHNPKSVQDLQLPNLEDPQKLLTPANLVLGEYERWKIYPQPMGLGFIGKNSYPRYTLAGLSPDQATGAEIERQRSMQAMPRIGQGASDSPPPPSPILNCQFFNGASQGLAFPYLVGNESILLANLDKEIPQINFNLPGQRPKGWLNVGEGPIDLKMVLHTVLIYPETRQCCLTWRGSAYYGGPEALGKITALEYGLKGI